MSHSGKWGGYLLLCLPPDPLAGQILQVHLLLGQTSAMLWIRCRVSPSWLVSRVQYRERASFFHLPRGPVHRRHFPTACREGYLINTKRGAAGIHVRGIFQ